MEAGHGCVSHPQVDARLKSTRRCERASKISMHCHRGLEQAEILPMNGEGNSTQRKGARTRANLKAVLGMKCCDRAGSGLRYYHERTQKEGRPASLKGKVLGNHLLAGPSQSGGGTTSNKITTHLGPYIEKPSCFGFEVHTRVQRRHENGGLLHIGASW